MVAAVIIGGTPLSGGRGTILGAVLGLIQVMQQAAVRAGCQLRVVEQGTQGPDHPIHPAIPETEYLKGYTYELMASW